MTGAIVLVSWNAMLLAAVVLPAAALGNALLTCTDVSFSSRAENGLYSLATGFGIMGYSLFVLGAVGLFNRWSIGALMVVGFFAAVRWLIRTLKKKRRGVASKPAGVLLLESDRIAAVLLVAALTASFLLVLTPPVGNDSLSYHLAVPKLYLTHKGFFPIPGNIFSNYPLLSEMLYLLALALNSDIAAKGIHFFSCMAILVGMGVFGIRHMGLNRGIATSQLIFFTIPSVFATAPLAYSDMTFSLFVLLAVHAYMNWYETGQSGWLWLCAAMSGLAAATKYAGLFLPFIGLLGILWACRKKSAANPETIRLAAAYLMATVIVGSPFYIKNTVLTGNPLYPFFFGLFGGSGWDADQARRYDLFHRTLGMGRTFWDYLLLPWNISLHAKMYSPRFDGVVGPIFLLTLPFLAGVKKMATGVKITLVFCGVMFVFWAANVQQIRYLIPIFPFLSLLVVWVYTDYRRHRKPMAPLIAAGIVCGITAGGYHITRQFHTARPTAFIMGSESRADFYRRHIPAYDSFAYINTHLPEDAKIFMIYMKNLGYLCDRPYYSDSILESHTLEKILAAGDTSESIRLSMINRGFTHLLYDARLLLGDSGPLSDRDRDRFLQFQMQHADTIKIVGDRFHLLRIRN